MSEVRLDKFEDLETGDPVVVKYELEIAKEELKRLAEEMTGLLEYLDKAGQTVTDGNGKKVLSVVVDEKAKNIWLSSI